MFRKAKEIGVLKDIARNVRMDILRALHHAKSGHTGGSLSSVEILVALYFSELRHYPTNPRWEDRDGFILSKGHGAPALYCVLANAGYFPREDLMTLKKPGSRLQGHPEYDLDIAVEATTGSLGHGLSVANGLALSARSFRIGLLL